MAFEFDISCTSAIVIIRVGGRWKERGSFGLGDPGLGGDIDFCTSRWG